MKRVYLFLWNICNCSTTLTLCFSVFSLSLDSFSQQTKLFQSNEECSVTPGTFMGENKFAKSHSLRPHAVTWDEVFDLRWLPIFPLLYFFLSGLVTEIVTSESDLWHPGVPLRWPLDAAQHRGVAVISPDKRLSVPGSPLMSPTKHTESTLGPLGFIYPFLYFGPWQRVDWGVKFVRCLSCIHLTTSHTAFEIPNAFWRILPIHVVGFHVLHSPLKRYVGETFLAGMRQPEYNLKAFPKETFTRECSPTSMGVIEGERTALHIQSQDGNSSAAGDLELLFQNGGERGELSVGWCTKLKVNRSFIFTASIKRKMLIFNKIFEL